MLKDKLLRNAVNIANLVCILLSFVFYKFFNLNNNKIFFILSLIFGTSGYHLSVHLGVGYLINFIYKNEMDYNKKWFKPLAFEENFYKKLNVRNWKDKIPTFHPDTFSFKKHSPEKIAKVMCQSEIVHEIIIVLSIFPIFYSLHYNIAPLFFIITSFCAVLFDTSLVIMQRYNRPRILKMAKRFSKYY